MYTIRDRISLNRTLMKHGSITNREYQNINNTTRYTATRDLGGIVKEGIFDKIGEGKRNLRYVLIQNAAKRRLRDFARHKLWACVFGGGF